MTRTFPELIARGIVGLICPTPVFDMSSCPCMEQRAAAAPNISVAETRVRNIGRSGQSSRIVTWVMYSSWISSLVCTRPLSGMNLDAQAGSSASKPHSAFGPHRTRPYGNDRYRRAQGDVRVHRAPSDHSHDLSIYS